LLIQYMPRGCSFTRKSFLKKEFLRTKRERVPTQRHSLTWDTDKAGSLC
jgi:hypothetical protein